MAGQGMNTLVRDRTSTIDENKNGAGRTGAGRINNHRLKSPAADTDGNGALTPLGSVHTAGTERPTWTGGSRPAGFAPF